ncbi:MAG TPA: chemotaxis protein CheB, partial [Gemmatimonadaceae bacterium]|nr:chemotaxis protein CheB [Gemmatimonadaceae bacterium]
MNDQHEPETPGTPSPGTSTGNAASPENQPPTTGNREDPVRGPTASKLKPTIVGIGASAGGLSALKAFFSHVPSDSNLAFVVVVHLSPEHESHLSDLLQPYVSIPVQ